MIRKLQKKFIVAAIIAVFLVLLLLIGAINIINYRSLVADADSTLQILAENGGSFPGQMLRPQQDAPPPEGGRTGALEPRPGDFGELAYQSRYFAAWFDADGNCTRLDLENVASQTEEDARSLAESVYAKSGDRGFADAYRYRRTSADGETMLLFLNCQRELATFRTFLYASAGISAIGLLAVFLLLVLFSGRIVRPIAESYEKQKRFITDAGHELKTPITIIQADADVLASELEAEDNEWITDIRRQTHRLAELTSDLVYLSKMEETDAALAMQAFPLSELAEETAQSFRSVARAQNKQFDASIAPDLQICGDEKAVAKLLSILLDNAMKYSTPEGTVTLALERVGKNARLTVRNSTAPMEPGNADHLFERFARADASRSSETGGFGLGLAIAKAVTEAHKGRIHAESEDGVSLKVTAELPLS